MAILGLNGEVILASDYFEPSFPKVSFNELRYNFVMFLFDLGISIFSPRCAINNHQTASRF